MVRHVILLLCQFVNYIEVKKLPVSPFGTRKGRSKLYAENDNLILSDVGLAEKRVCHAVLNGNVSMPPVLHQKDD
ncbi:lysophospholipid acyltransferase LPEAT1-like [Salvia hispanica]|uniref:lysophospholipid acyltransferase LPEAT1-like n=1 Tax=Salvia hispanica TaxID=49212 RepID=UPI002009B1DB|nr:lysophospholipid acyltransferase LPEAT1-like [Salvia hispanica]